MPKYIIADTIVNINFADNFFKEHYAPYLANNHNISTINPNIAETNIDIKVVDSLDEYTHNLGSPTINATNLDAYNIDNGQIVVYDKPIPRMLVKYDNNYDNIDIIIASREQDIHRPNDLLEYMFTGIYLYHKLILNNNIMLHGSAIAYDNSGIIFTAPSGTGKSTHTGLWKQVYGDSVDIINDDKPIISFTKPTPYVHGTPFCGKALINSNAKAPLKAIIYLKQAPYNKMELLPISQSVGLLLEQILKSFLDKRIVDESFVAIEKIIQSVPIYVLHCLPNTDAVDCVVKQLKKDKVL